MYMSFIYLVYTCQKSWMSWGSNSSWQGIQRNPDAIPAVSPESNYEWLLKCPNFILGLKQAITTVNDYNPLMKDFPLDDLLSATELDKIKLSLTLIFGHLKKIRNTKYPIQRALRLVEAISRDLSTQLLKVEHLWTFLYTCICL